MKLKNFFSKTWNCSIHLLFFLSLKVVNFNFRSNVIKMFWSCEQENSFLHIPQSYCTFFIFIHKNMYLKITCSTFWCKHFIYHITVLKQYFTRQQNVWKIWIMEFGVWSFIEWLKFSPKDPTTKMYLFRVSNRKL